jgi:hypothetical protein
MLIAAENKVDKASADTLAAVRPVVKPLAIARYEFVNGGIPIGTANPVNAARLEDAVSFSEMRLEIG